MLPVWIQDATQAVNNMTLCSGGFSCVSDWVLWNAAFHFTHRQNLFWMLFIPHVRCLFLPFIFCCLLSEGGKSLYLSCTNLQPIITHRIKIIKLIIAFQKQKPFWKCCKAVTLRNPTNTLNYNPQAWIIDKQAHQMTWRPERKQHQIRHGWTLQYKNKVAGFVFQNKENCNEN